MAYVVYNTLRLVTKSELDKLEPSDFLPKWYDDSETEEVDELSGLREKANALFGGMMGGGPPPSG